MVEDAPQGVLRVVVGHAVLDRFADGYAEAPGVVGVLLEELPPRACPRAGRSMDLGAVDLHHDAPVGLLFVAAPGHVDREVDVEESAARARALPH